MNILLVCACGSSTSVVLQKMKENEVAVGCEEGHGEI